MFKCPKCNAEFAENKNFCEFCGAQLEAVEAPAAEAPVVETPVAEAPVVEAPVAETPVVDVPPVADAFYAPVDEPTKKPFNVKKLLTFGIPVVAVVLVLVIALSIFVKPSEPSYLFYKKDGEIWFTKASKLDPIEISKEKGGSSVTVSQDGKYIFFYDNTKDDTELCYVKAGDKKAEPKKIDTEVSTYVINEKGTTVTYIKDGDLYQHNLKDRTKISADVSKFYVSTDGNKIYYVKTNKGDNGVEYDLYLKNGKKDAKKLATDINRDSLRFTKKFDTAYYTITSGKGEDQATVLYKQVGTKDKVKISGDNANLIIAYDSGDVYFQTMVKNDDEYEYSLCLYDGKKVKTITKNFDSVYTGSSEEMVLVYSTVEGEGDDREEKYFVLTGDVSNEIKNLDVEKNRYDFDMTEDGKTVYYTATAKEDNDDNLGDVYEIAVSGKKIKEAKSYVKDVNSFYVSYDGYLVHTKDAKDGKATYFVDNKKVADDVNSFSYSERLGGFVYKTDTNDEGEYTLNTYIKGKITKISDDVADHATLANGDIYYIKDMENGKGTLYLHSGKKAKKVDEDVTYILGFTYLDKDATYLYGNVSTSEDVYYVE